jgi:hypothetical protein
LLFERLLGSIAINALVASGGNAGNGSVGVGTGTSARGGTGGYGGRITVLNTLSGELVTNIDNTAVVSKTATDTAGTFGVTTKANL